MQILSRQRGRACSAAAAPADACLAGETTTHSLFFHNFIDFPLLRMV
jgi:hypothetical protein